MSNECTVIDDMKMVISPIVGDEEMTADIIKAMLKFFGGSSPYFRKNTEKELLRLERNTQIKEEFTGNNYDYLMRKYDLTERQIRTITKGENGGQIDITNSFADI